MNISHERIDENTFVVLTDNGYVVTYKVGDNVTDLDIFGFIFTENELEYRNNKLSKLYGDKKELKFRLKELRSDIRNLKRINYQIKTTKSDIDRLKRYSEILKKETKVREVCRQTKVLKK